MKSFDRFAHQGVTQELSRLKEFTSAFGDFKYGSSGDGEITIQGLNAPFTPENTKQKAAGASSHIRAARKQRLFRLQLRQF
ncbi:hypothetical protein [Pseudomonas sp. PS02288]|uniref:hypothetical protein n=1 Tax=Pseudomonas sp. PS02288 TaxID=2991443 RepID=UPI00249BD99B|nr:hypothetical protein [Pseudomonas sp. PS02288]